MIPICLPSNDNSLVGEVGNFPEFLSVSFLRAATIFYSFGFFLFTFLIFRLAQLRAGADCPSMDKYLPSSEKFSCQSYQTASAWGCIGNRQKSTLKKTYVQEFWSKWVDPEDLRVCGHHVRRARQLWGGQRRSHGGQGMPSKMKQNLENISPMSSLSGEGWKVATGRDHQLGDRLWRPESTRSVHENFRVSLLDPERDRKLKSLWSRNNRLQFEFELPERVIFSLVYQNIFQSLPLFWIVILSGSEYCYRTPMIYLFLLSND